MEARRKAIAEQQERIATSQSAQAGLASKKATLTDELSRLKAERPAYAADLSEKKTELDNRAKAIDAKRVEAMAEDKGVEGTGKAGKGPVYRERMGELAKMQEYVKIQDDRVKDASKRLTAVDTRIAQLERELAAIDGDIAKLKGEAQTAESRIKMAEEAKTGEEGPKVDPARVRASFEKARAEFRQEPTVERLAALHGQCAQLYGAMIATPATKDKVRSIDCDPKQAAEAAAVVFAINAGSKVFEQQCAGGDKLTQHKSTDALFGFAKKCLADSGLPSKDTDELRTKINFIELNRDDKAHRFVVTWNAFLDGNRLAYLALAIAITIDSLVFMSGLFGANALRSPLQDVPSHKARSAKDLESIVESALLPDKFEAAHAVLEAMQPITPVNGFTQEIVVPGVATPERNMVLKVLNAAALIGAVVRDDMDPRRYLVRGELFEFLSIVAKKAFEKDKERVALAELRKVVTVALQPYVGDHAEVVLGYCHPMNERNGFSSEIFLKDVEAGDLLVVRKTLNAAATLNYVQQDDRKDQTELGRYYVHKQLYRTLAMIAASVPKTGQKLGLPQIAARPGPAHGGDLTQRPGPLPPSDGALPRRLEGPAQERQDAAVSVPTAGSPPPLRRHGRDEMSAEELKGYYWSSMVGALGINPQLALARLSSPDIEPAALDAWRALSDLSRHNEKLESLLESHKNAQLDKLGQAYSSMLRHANNDQAKKDTLDGVDDQIQASLPALMLFPELGLLDYLITSIEAPAAHDEGLASGEDELLNRLRHIRETMAGADPNNVQTWRWFGHALRELSAAHRQKIARFTPKRDNLH
jgi:hypothetical protein